MRAPSRAHFTMAHCSLFRHLAIFENLRQKFSKAAKIGHFWRLWNQPWTLFDPFNPFNLIFRSLKSSSAHTLVLQQCNIATSSSANFVAYSAPVFDGRRNMGLGDVVLWQGVPAFGDFSAQNLRHFSQNLDYLTSFWGSSGTRKCQFSSIPCRKTTSPSSILSFSSKSTRKGKKLAEDSDPRPGPQPSTTWL